MIDYGIIFVKTTSDGRPVVIRAEHDLGNMWGAAYVAGTPAGRSTVGLINPVTRGGSTFTHAVGKVALTAAEAATVQAGIEAAWTAHRATEAGQFEALTAQRRLLVSAYHGAIAQQAEDFERAHDAERADAWAIKNAHEPAITAARQAISDFDAAHPEVIATQRAETAESVERNRWN